MPGGIPVGFCVNHLTGLLPGTTAICIVFCKTPDNTGPVRFTTCVEINLTGFFSEAYPFDASAIDLYLGVNLLGVAVYEHLEGRIV